MATALELARDAEVGLRLAARSVSLDVAEQLIADGQAEPPPAGRDWLWEVRAERAVDLARLIRSVEAAELAREVLAGAPADARLARARATEALGRALAWTGTDDTTAEGSRKLTEAAELYGALGATEWQAYAVFFLGNAVHLQNGNLLQAELCMREALAMLPADSPRRATVLSFYCDVLLALGRWEDVLAPLDEGMALARAADDPMSRAYVTWSRARLASAKGDAPATERLIREVERDAADWFDIHTGSTFLADAAEMLDRVGQRDQAVAYLTRAEQRDPQDEFVAMARATLLARRGDPLEALEALQSLVRGTWLEKRHVWRLRLMTAYATARLGGGDAGRLAADALELAASQGSAAVATRAEPQMVAALLPLAEQAGSAVARQVLAGGSGYLVRLFGTTRVTRADGSAVHLPPGQPAELVRMLAVQPQGLPVETVLDRFFPDVPAARSRQRLRQIMTRLRNSAGDLVVRTDDHVELAPAWVDVRAFREAADRVRGTRGPRAAELARPALALWTGPPLPSDAFADWATKHRRMLAHRCLLLLDLVADEAAARGSYEEALAALMTAIDIDAHDPTRHALAAEHLRALGRPGAARHLLDSAPEL